MRVAVGWIVWVLVAGTAAPAGSVEGSGVTTLANPSIRFTRPDKPYVVLARGDVEAAVVDNSAVDDDVLPGHRGGYSGVGSLKHAQRSENLFVTAYAGLNFEHIHDGTVQEDTVLYEPRNARMELRVIDEHTVELYQPPTPHFGLESALRYAILTDGTLEMTLECIPRRRSFQNGYIGLFWASYIHQPESLDIHFRGYREGGRRERRWIRGVTPAHGTFPTHLAADDQRQFAHDPDFPLKLVFNRSRYRYSDSWYYGVSHGMAYVQMFRAADQVRLTQSPSGGGSGNPAWDFQFFVPDYEVDRLYRMVMRAMYLPFASSDEVERATAAHRMALNPPP